MLKVYNQNGEIKYTLVSNMLVGPVLSVAGNTTLDSSHYIVLVTATATITLPDATLNPGRQYIVKNRGTGITITIDTTDSQLIDDDLTLTISAENVSVTLAADAANSTWVIL